MALVLVQLARGDYVAAEKAFKEWGNCCDAPEVQNLEMLLQGFDDEDPDLVRQALNHPFIKHMDVEYARLARDLPLPEGISAPKAPMVRENAAPSYVSPNATSVVTADVEVSALYFLILNKDTTAIYLGRGKSELINFWISLASRQIMTWKVTC